MSITTYFIGGIATDARLYAHQLEHIPNSIYLPFPRNENTDSMETYILKFLPLINTEKPFNIVGCSMGGIMTMELLKHLHPQKVILISSVKHRSEMPWRLKQLKYSELHKIVSGRMFILGTILGSRFIKELNTLPSLRTQVIEMAKNNTPEFLHWCVNAIVHWEGTSLYRKDIIHLHGDKDSMFPIKNIIDPIIIKGGSHNMLLTNPADITQLLFKYFT